MNDNTAVIIDMMARMQYPLEHKLIRRATLFEDEFARLDKPEEAFGLRITVAPTDCDAIHLPRIHEQFRSLVDGLTMPTVKVSRLFRENAGVRNVEESRNIPRSDWAPRLRAVRTCNTNDEHPRFRPSRVVYTELHCDGLAEFGLLSCYVHDFGNNKKLLMTTDAAICELARVACQADALCQYAHPGDQLDYVVDVSIHVRGHALHLSWTSNLNLGSTVGNLPEGVTRLPRYSFRDVAEDLPELLTSFERDLHHVAGKDIATGRYVYECKISESR